MTEGERIEVLSRTIGEPSQRVRIGIGDDAAVLGRPRSGELLFCSDAMVEGVHFDMRYTTAMDLGHKSLAACLSDIAAMNGQPLHALFTLALPRELPDSFIEEFYTGASRLARELEVDIVGGDLSLSRSGLFIDVAGLGQTENAKTRSGARVGDLLVVSGFPGLSAAGFCSFKAESQVPEILANAHLRPRPRFDLLAGLNANGKLCTALIDLSDGLASEVHHLARNSKVGFVIESSQIPLHPEAKSAAQSLGQDALEWAFSGGEDYELIATLDPNLLKKLGKIPKGFTVIGRAVDASEGVSVVDSEGANLPLAAKGFEHFSYPKG